MNRILHVRPTLLAICLAMGMALTACSGANTPGDIPPDSSGPGTASSSSPMETVITPDTAPEVSFPTEPSIGSYEPAGETVVTLSGTEAGADITLDGAGAEIDGHTVTITRAGSYLFSGSLSDGQIVVDTTDTEKVTLRFNGVSLACAAGPAIFVKQAPKKVVIETVPGSVNLLSDGADYVVPDENQVEGEVYPNACIYACDDLTFDGQGTLYITGRADKGVNTKDDLKIKGGTLVVSSMGVGLRGNDSVTVSDGHITVVSGRDGLKSANTEKEGKGTICVEGGTLYITATGDGLSAATDMSITGGTLVITTRDVTNGGADDGGMANGHIPDGDMPGGNMPGGDVPGGNMPGGDVPGGNMPGGDAPGGNMPGGDVPGGDAPGDNMPGGNMPGGNRPGGDMPGGGRFDEGNSNKSSISAKGLKAAGTLTVSGGKLTVDAADDGLHSNDTVLIQGGQLHICSADDGIHADKVLTVSGGVTEVVESYEGMEANQLTISGGTNRIYASDDGLNANGGSAMGRPGDGWFGGSNESAADGDTVTEPPLLTISGGYTVIYADGDGLDSNGNIIMTDGTVLVFGPTDSDNGAIDYGDGSYRMTVSGGTFLAVGSSNMAESATGDGQGVLNATRLRSSIAAGTLMGIRDADGHIIAAFKLPKTISSMVFSSPAMVAGKSYTIVRGGQAGTVTDGVVTDPTTYTGYSDATTMIAS